MAVNWAKLVKELVEASKVERSGLADLEKLGALAGLARMKAVVANADEAGLVGATETASRNARLTELASDVAEKAEKAVKEAVDGSATSALWFRRITKPIPDRGLEEVWSRISLRDVRRLIREIVHIAAEGGEVTHNKVAGAIREMVAKHVGELRRIVIAEKIRIRQLGKKEGNLSILDTGTMGKVELPTRYLPANKQMPVGHDLMEGTDRIIGIARGEPEDVWGITKSGEKIKITVQGELEVTIVIEVKGRTTVAVGERQVEALLLEGRGLRGYVVIDGKYWLLKYDPEKVHHVVVAARTGSGFERLAETSNVIGGGPFTLIEIPLGLDQEIVIAARRFLEGFKEIMTWADFHTPKKPPKKP
jgi:hypothetical protein